MKASSFTPILHAAPPGTKNIVIFDTNAYRSFAGRRHDLSASRTRAKALAAHERAAKNLAIANPIVVWELLSHLADKSDKDYDDCLNAVVVLYEHCKPPHNETVNQFADAQLTVCHELFEVVSPAELQRVEQLGQHAAHVGKNAPDLTNAKVLANLKVFANEMKRREDAWTDDMKKIVSELGPELAKAWIGKGDTSAARKLLVDFFGSDSFMGAWANVTVIEHAELVGAQLNTTQISEKAEYIRRVFPVPFKLLSSLMQKFVENPDIDVANPKKKRWNFIWDFAICFSIGSEHGVSAAPIRFVTSDAAIVDAAVAAGCPPGVVISLDSHLSDVGLC